MGRTFTVATDEAVIELIRRARERLVVIAPALTLAVAEALVSRFPEIGQLEVRVVLDADPEVYRLGFGEQAALKIIREAASNNQLDLRQQTGVRVGVIVADNETMIFSPVSKNIEAGSLSAEKPNAVLLSGTTANEIALAAGITKNPTHDDTSVSPEIGAKALEQQAVARMEEDLRRNPPARFDITRRLNVFSSRVVYIEFEVKNSKLAMRTVKLPKEFGTVSNRHLRDQISASMKVPFADIGKVTVVLGEGRATRSYKIDEKWLDAERKRIVDRFTFQIDNFGRVILREDREKFEKDVLEFKEMIQKYQSEVREKVLSKRAAFVALFVQEFLPRWKKNPPDYMFRWGDNTDVESVREELERRAADVFEQMLDFAPPVVRLVEKNISPKNVEDPEFLEPLRTIMERRHVPREIIDTLFATTDAVVESRRST